MAAETRRCRAAATQRWQGLKSRVNAVRPSLVNVQKDLALYAPSSAGSHAQIRRLTLQGANAIFPALEGLQRDIGLTVNFREMSAQDFCDETDSRQDADQLRTLFDRCGSDKGSHGYHFVYARILRNPASIQRLLEVGIGTNNTGVVSNMGQDGVPGASLRAFREFLPKAHLYGADYDRNILFNEARISTFYCDQTSYASMEDLARELPPHLDVVIDDGLHAPQANVNTLRIAIGILAPGGWAVIEDIAREHLPVWRCVGGLLPSGRFESFIIEAQQKFLFLVRQLENV